jgi:DNA-binding NtrC family response regulator
MPSLLLIDDERAIHDFFRSGYIQPVFDIVSEYSAGAGTERFAAQRPDLVVLDVGLPDMSGLDAFTKLHAVDPRVPVIIITGSGTTETAIQAMALGAYDYVRKPFSFDAISTLLAKALRDSELMRVSPILIEEDSQVTEAEAMVGRCPAMHDVFKAIGRVARHDMTVLILGESGTGKELVARSIYQFSRRARQVFLPINCAAIPEQLLESELFGHEKGAFTGADQRRIGKFEQCSGGTLFLDEIGDMTPLTQAKILRVLQEQQFERLGGNETIRTDVRVIAATNRDLQAMMMAGQFRRDLFYRLNVYPINLPPLRERQADIPLLVTYGLRRLRAELGKDISGVSPAAMELLCAYGWPGNVRELQSTLRFAALQAVGPVIVPDCLPRQLLAPTLAPPVAGPAAACAAFVDQALARQSSKLYADYLAIQERELLSEVLQRTRGNITSAAKMLGISRVTLRARLSDLGIQRDKNGPAGAPDGHRPG